MNRKLIALGAAGAAAIGMAFAAPAAQADPVLELCVDIDVNGQGSADCIVLPPEDGGGLPGLPTLP